MHRCASLAVAAVYHVIRDFGSSAQAGFVPWLLRGELRRRAVIAPGRIVATG